jgi:hypothetical protein
MAILSGYRHMLDLTLHATGLCREYGDKKEETNRSTYGENTFSEFQECLLRWQVQLSADSLADVVAIKKVLSNIS